jgi:TRAP-type uncharacterized transport system substrate-binding protein
MKKLLITFALAFFATVSFSQALKVSTGGSSGTYSRTFKELSGVCSQQLPLAELNSSGSTQNLDRLTGNEVNGAFVQTDVLFYRSRTEDLSNIKTLLALYPEEVHVVSLAVLKDKEGGTLGFGAKTVQLNSITDLSGRTVVAAGGSYVTAQVIRLQTEIDFKIVEVASADEALKAVAAGTAHAAIVVGGVPLPNITALDKNFKLLSFPEATAAKLKNVYRPSKLNYSKMGATGVATVATDALFVTRTYTTPKFVDGLSKLRGCVLQNLAELQETTGYSPAWQKMEPSNQGKWAYMVLPVAKK